MGHPSPERQGAASSDNNEQKTKVPSPEKLLPKPGETDVLSRGANQGNSSNTEVARLPKIDLPKNDNSGGMREDSVKHLSLNMTDEQRTALKNIASAIVQNSAGYLDQVGKARASFKYKTEKDERDGIYPPVVKEAMQRKSQLSGPFNPMKRDEDVKKAREDYLAIDGDKHVLKNVPFPGLDNIERTCIDIARQNPGLRGQSIYARMARSINDELKSAGSSERVSVSSYVRMISPGDSTHAPKYSEDFMLYCSSPLLKNGPEVVALLPGNVTLVKSREKIK